MHVEFPIISFICCLLVLAPLPWHWRAGTIPTIAITFWMFLGNLINGVNAIVWGDNVIIKIPVWCDITTKIQLGSNLALPAAVLCLCIQLEQVSSNRQVQASLADKRRRQIWNFVLCFILPVFYMVLHYVVQGHRFDIIEDFGCRPSIYNSVASIFIVWFLPLVVSLAAGGFSAVALRHFWIRRITFARHLQSKNTVLTAGHYFRLMAMSLVQIFYSVVITSLNMWFTMKSGLRPWISWEDVHLDFGRIGQFPQVLIPQNIYGFTYALWWTIPISSVLFFAFFAFGKDAVKEYSAGFRWIRRSVLRRPDPPAKAKGSSLLPSYVGRDNNVIKLSTLSPTTQSSFAKADYPVTPTTTAVGSDFDTRSLKVVDIDAESIVSPSEYGSETTHATMNSFQDGSTFLHDDIHSPNRPMSFPSFFSKYSTR